MLVAIRIRKSGRRQVLAAIKIRKERKKTSISAIGTIEFLD